MSADQSDTNKICACKLKYVNTIKWTTFKSDDTYETFISKGKMCHTMGAKILTVIINNSSLNYIHHFLQAFI